VGILWNKQDPPVSDQALAKIGYITVPDPAGVKICREHAPLSSAFGNFFEVKWRETPRGPSLVMGEITLGYPRGGEEILFVMQRLQPSEYFDCRFCSCKTCRIETTTRRSEAPVFYFMRCPECGATGPHGFTRREASERWSAFPQRNVTAKQETLPLTEPKLKEVVFDLGKTVTQRPTGPRKARPQPQPPCDKCPSYDMGCKNQATCETRYWHRRKGVPPPPNAINYEELKEYFLKNHGIAGGCENDCLEHCAGVLWAWFEERCGYSPQEFRFPTCDEVIEWITCHDGTIEWYIKNCKGGDRLKICAEGMHAWLKGRCRAGSV